MNGVYHLYDAFVSKIVATFSVEQNKRTTAVSNWNGPLEVGICSDCTEVKDILVRVLVDIVWIFEQAAAPPQSTKKLRFVSKCATKTK